MDANDLAIVHYPSKALRKRCAPITEIDDDLVAVTERMLALMYEGRGVGLAGPQVGLSKRLFVMSPSGDRAQEDARVVLNPVIERRRGKQTDIEGCLSLPGLNARVERAEAITLRYFDLDGDEVEVELEGWEARIAQHENDHLDGVLIIDRMSAGERSLAEPRLREMAREREHAHSE